MNFVIRCICAAVFLLTPAQLLAEIQLFKGDLNIITSSGKLCSQLSGHHTISLVIINDSAKPEVSGYLGGKDITVGKFLGVTPARMKVIYPYYDEETATGHMIALFNSESLLVGELREKHMNSADEVCSFDLARLNLKLVAEGEPAKIELVKMAKLFDAKLADSTAHSFAKKGEYESALPFFQKALDLSDAAQGFDSFSLDSAILGLASSYFKLSRFEDFNRIYDTRFSTVTTESFRSILNSQRVIVQLNVGHAAIKNEEYDKALSALIPTYQLSLHKQEVSSAIVTAYIRSDRFDEALSFLEQEGSKSDSDGDRKDITDTIALVNFLKAKKDEKDGKQIEAEADLRKAVHLKPSVASFWVALARQRHKGGSFANAKKVLDEGLDHMQNDPSRQEINAALEKMQQVEIIMKSIR